MPGFKYTLKSNPPFINNQYQSDDEGYESPGGSTYQISQFIGNGTNSVAYKLSSQQSPKELVVLKPKRPQLIRLSKNPSLMKPKELNELFHGLNLYIIFNTKIFFLTKQGHLSEFMCRDHSKIQSLFPYRTNYLQFPSKKRLSQLVELLYIPGYNHSVFQVDIEEVRQKFALQTAVQPSNDLALFEMENDAVMLMNYYSGIPYKQVKADNKLEQIDAILATVLALKKCLNPCRLIKLESMYLQDLRNELGEDAAYVLTSDDLLYYVDKNFAVTELEYKHIQQLRLQFPQTPNKSSIATRDQLHELFLQTSHRHQCRVYMDLNVNNFLFNYEIKDGQKINWQISILDGGSWVAEGSDLPAEYRASNEEGLTLKRQKHYHYAPESFTVAPDMKQADRSMDIYSFGMFITLVFGVLQGSLGVLIARCKNLNPNIRPSIEYLESYLIFRRLIYSTRFSIETYSVDFSKAQDEQEVGQYKQLVIKELTAIIQNPILIQAMIERGYNLDSTYLKLAHEEKIKSVEILAKQQLAKIVCSNSSATGGLHGDNRNIIFGTYIISEHNVPRHKDYCHI